MYLLFSKMYMNTALCCWLLVSSQGFSLSCFFCGFALHFCHSQNRSLSLYLTKKKKAWASTGALHVDCILEPLNRLEKFWSLVPTIREIPIQFSVLLKGHRNFKSSTGDWNRKVHLRNSHLWYWLFLNGMVLDVGLRASYLQNKCSTAELCVSCKNVVYKYIHLWIFTHHL